MTRYIISAMTIGSVYTLFALGLNLTWGILNVLNLAHGALLMSGALTGYLVATSFGLPLMWTLVAAVLVCGSLGVGLQVLVFGPIERWNTDYHSMEFAMLLAGVGSAGVLVGVAENITSRAIVSIPRSTLEITYFTVLGVRVTNAQVIILVTALVLSGCLIAFVTRTRYGRAMRALAYDSEATSMLGVRSSQLSIITFFVSGALAGVAGVLLALHLGAVHAHMGESLLLKAFAVIILGGVGSIGGTVIAAFLLALLEAVVGTSLGGTVRDLVAFILIIVLLLVRPQGLFARRAWQRV